MYVAFKRKINPPLRVGLSISCRVSTPLRLVRYSWKIRLMETKGLQFSLIFLLYVHMFLYDHVHTWAYSVLFAETNGSGVTDSASVSFPNYHTCSKKRAVWIPPSVPGVRLVQSCVSHSSDLSDASLKPVMSGMKCGGHWGGMFYRNEGLQGKDWKWKKSHDGLCFSSCQMQLGSQPGCLEKKVFHILVTKFFFLIFPLMVFKVF